MKLIIQIPCWNEASNISATLDSLPRDVPGFDKVEWLVIDDGSTDDTSEIARNSGADHIVRHTHNLGLAQAFMTGIHACLKRGADVIVNTDADNQYLADDIPLLTSPIISGSADFVIGARPIGDMEHFSRPKRMLQKIGSWIVRLTSNTTVPDAPSGFRAITKSVARRLIVFNNYTYTLETIIQAGLSGLRVISVPVRVNATERPSRLIRSIPEYIRRSVVTIVRIFVLYRPFRFFATLGTMLLSIGMAIGVRFLFFFFAGEGVGHVQSLLLASVFLVVGFQTILIAFIADGIAANRRLLEDIRAAGLP